jgi:hypothetical protein
VGRRAPRNDDEHDVRARDQMSFRYSNTTSGTCVLDVQRTEMAASRSETARRVHALGDDILERAMLELRTGAALMTTAIASELLAWLAWREFDAHVGRFVVTPGSWAMEGDALVLCARATNGAQVALQADARIAGTQAAPPHLKASDR